MNGGDPSGAFRDIGALFNVGMLGELTDRQLLERFALRDDGSGEEAFNVLLWRHGPMVWGVCRRMLPDRSDAADAYQATFLVLARKASAVRVDDSLSPWLYGVSRRVAARARATSQRRGARETGGVEALAGEAPDSGLSERLAILDEEIGRLPERYRAVVVLCDLESLPHEEAARRLGCPVGTVESRLSRGRQRLRDRLLRRGFAPTAVGLWVEVARESSASIPVALLKSSARFVPGSPAAGVLSTAVTSLAEGVIRMIWFARLKPLAAIAAALIVVAGSVAGQGRRAAAGAGEQAKAAAPPPSTAEAGVGPVTEANRALAREQLALIDETWDMLHRMVRSKRLNIADAHFELWGRRKLEMLRKAGAGKAEIVASLEKYVDTLKEDEILAKDLFENARSTKTALNDVKFRRIEAQMWLNEEKAR